MGKRRWKAGSPGVERIAFLVLLGVVAGLLVASTQIGDDTQAPPQTTGARPVDTLRSGGLTALVGDSVVIRATSETGRRRDRVRVVLAVQLRSDAAKPLSARRALRLEYSGRKVLPDVAATKEQAALDLSTPMAPGTTRTGEVRFELAGSDTRVLRNRGDARLILVAPGGARDGVTLEFDVPS